MNLPRPFKNVFKNKAIYRGSDWMHEFALRDYNEETKVYTPIDLTGYTVTMTISPSIISKEWTEKIVRTFVPTDNKFVLFLSSADQILAIPNFKTPDIRVPMKACIEISLSRQNETVILIRDEIDIYSTIRGD